MDILSKIDGITNKSNALNSVVSRFLERILPKIESSACLMDCDAGGMCVFGLYHQMYGSSTNPYGCVPECQEVTGTCDG